MTRERSAGRSGGRAGRLRQRAAPPAVNPAAPGQRGGQYRPLSQADCAAIHQMALKLLAELGMGAVPLRLADLLIGAGAVTAGDRVLLPRELVGAALAGAAKRFALHGRDPARSIEVGGETVHFGTGGAAVQTLDIDSGRYRPSTLRDLHDFTRLQDVLTNVSWFTRCCIATDVEDPFDLDVNTAYALLRNTTKPVATSFSLPEHVAPIVEMFDIASGGPGRFAARPFAKVHVSPVIPPLRFGEDAVDVVFECLAHGIPVTCITAALSGATAPAVPAGFLAQSHAETLASLAMVHVIKPGHPMVFSNWPFVVDLRTGAFSGDGPEAALLNAASAQLGNWLGLPTGVAAAMTDAKAVDAQYGVEKAMTALATGLAGGNLVYESSGMTASLLGASFEAFVLDDEMLSSVYRILRGVEVTPETLDFGAIRSAVLGEGHFLGQPDTMAAMERDFVYPQLADRQAPGAWAEQGGRDAWDRARARARAILAEPGPDYLGAAKDAAIRRRFRILG